jgi:Domain of unknown function (DUF5658)
VTRPRQLALAALLLLQAGDLVSTKLALSVPGIVEFNPLVRWLGVWPAKLVLVAVAVIVVLRTKKLWRAWACAGYYCLVVGSNLLLYWNHRS